MHERPALRTAAAAALVAGIGLVYWAVHILGGVRLPQRIGFFNRDLFTIYQQIYTFAYQSAELLPRWNPHQLAGTPFLANYNGGFLYPPHLLAAVLPVEVAMGMNGALHLALGGLLTFACARTLALARPAAVFAAVIFMLNGYFVIEHFRISYLAGLAWVPGVFLAAGRLVQKATARRGAALGAVLAVQLLTGHAQIVCYSGYALGLAGVLWAVLGGVSSPRDLRTLGAAGLAAAIVFLGLAAVQLLPTLELVAHARRGFGGLTLAQVHAWTPTPALLQQVLLGSGPLVVLALPGLLGQRRRRFAIGAAVVAGCGIAIGLGTALYRDVFFRLPAVDLFRLPHAMLTVATVPLALLAGISVDGATGRTRVGWRQAAGGVTALSALWVLAPPPISRWFGITAITVWVLLPLGGRARILIAWTLVALLVGERFTHRPNRVMIPQSLPASYFAPPPFVDWLREHGDHGRVVIVKDWRDRYPITEKLGTQFGIDVVQDFEPLAPAIYQDFLRPFERVNVDAPLFWGRFFPGPTHPAWRLLDMLSTRWVLVAPRVAWPIEGGSGRFRLAYQGADARIYENRAALPRAYLVARHRVAHDEAALRLVHAPAFDPRREVVLDRQPVWPDTTTAIPARSAAVDVTGRSAGTVELQVTTPTPTLVVLTDLYWPGWHVSVDGDARPLLRANHLVRAVAVEPGRHVVRFWYRPTALWVGAAITCATLAILASFVLRGRSSWQRA